jgi:hypothetical protein
MIRKADEALEMLGALGEMLRALAPEATLVMATLQPAGGNQSEPDVYVWRNDSVLVPLPQ